MADSKITALTAISTVDPAADPLVIVDVSDTSMAASGTTKKGTINQLLGSGGTATLASATITGAATVGTTLGVTGVSTFAAGTALLPALTTTGDTNTGIYYPAADTFAVTTAGTERYRVDASGNVGIGVTPSAGKGCLQLSSGINFPATAVASADANTLDDYEEGTWTATLIGATTNPTTPVTATGRYTKVGRQVTVQVYIANVTTTGASGRIGVSGLPFANNGSIETIGAVGFYDIATFTGSPFAQIGFNATAVDLYSSVSNGVYQPVTHNAGTARYLWFNLTYTV